jgi:hypothetical protein
MGELVTIILLAMGGLVTIILRAVAFGFWLVLLTDEDEI